MTQVKFDLWASQTVENISSYFKLQTYVT